MATTILRPTAMYLNSGSTAANGAASKPVAASDQSDASDVRGNVTPSGPSGFFLEAYSFGTLAALPANSQLRSITPGLRHRKSVDQGGPTVGFYVYHQDTATTSDATSGAQSPNEFYTSPAAGVIRDSVITTRTTTAGGKTLATLSPTAAAAYVNQLAHYLGYGWNYGGSSSGLTTSLQVIEYFLTVVTNEAPVATAAAGFTAATSRPTFGWTYSDPEGDTQAAFRVKVFDQAAYSAGGFDPNTATPATGLDSGWVNSTATSWTPSTDLANSTTYRAFFFVTDTGSNGRTNVVTTASPYQQVAVSLTPPNAPTLTLNAVDATLRRVQLTVAATNNLSATATRYRFEVQRSTDAGVTWATVPRLQNSTLKFAAYQTVDYSAVASPSVVLYDYEAPYGSDQYRARVQATNSGNSLVSAWSSTVTAAVTTPTKWFIKSLSDATLNMTLSINNESVTYSSVEPQSVNRMLGRRYPIILGDVIGADRFEVELSILDSATWIAFRTLRITRATLLLENQYGERFYVRIGSLRKRTRTLGSYQQRVAIEFIEQDTPA